jgi:hypothetical protein
VHDQFIFLVNESTPFTNHAIPARIRFKPLPFSKCFFEAFKVAASLNSRTAYPLSRFPSEHELFVNDFPSILRIGMVLGSTHMLMVKVPAVVAGILFMSSVSAQAMEFADRPGIAVDVARSVPATRPIFSDDYSRRQINLHDILLLGPVAGQKLGDRPRPISLVRIRVTRGMSENRPGRLSAEFSAVVKPSGVKFEFGPGELASWLKPTATAVAVNFEDRRRPISARFKSLTTVNSNIADHHIFTSSFARVKPPVGLHVRPGAMKVAGEALHRD